MLVWILVVFLANGNVVTVDNLNSESMCHGVDTRIAFGAENVQRTQAAFKAGQPKPEQLIKLPDNPSTRSMCAQGVKLNGI